MKKLKLITEVCESVTINEDESKTLYLEGIFSSAELKNQNGRKYKKMTLEREINKLQSKIGKTLFGELNHPTYPDINLERATILIEKLFWDDRDKNNLNGKAVVLDTPLGEIVKAINKRGQLGISSRGLGSVNEDGYVDDKSYQLITWDIVSSPSNIPSWVNGIYESKEWFVKDDGIIVEDPKLTPEQQQEAKNEAEHELKLTLSPKLIHYLAEDNGLTLEDSNKIYADVVKKYISEIIKGI